MVTHSTPSCLLICSIILHTSQHPKSYHQPPESNVDLPLVHEKDMWATRHIRMDGHGEDKFIVFPIEIVKVVLFLAGQLRTRRG